MKRVYRRRDKKHLHHHLAEYDFRYHNCSAKDVEDQERSASALKCVRGKRLKYQGSSQIVDACCLETTKY